eukprot:9060596-Prorocentrum_lima.AAC.1
MQRSDDEAAVMEQPICAVGQPDRARILEIASHIADQLGLTKWVDDIQVHLEQEVEVLLLSSSRRNFLKLKGMDDFEALLARE